MSARESREKKNEREGKEGGEKGNGEEREGSGLSVFEREKRGSLFIAAIITLPKREAMEGGEGGKEEKEFTRCCTARFSFLVRGKAGERGGREKEEE